MKYSSTELTHSNEGESPASVVTVSSAPSDFSKPHWSPHDYQKRAIKLLLSQGSCGLFLDPGLGKTSIVLAALKILKGQGMFRRTLIIAPLRVAQATWPAEIEKWAEFSGLTWAVLHGKQKEILRTQSHDIHIINPEGLPWLLKHPLDYDLLVIDESTKFKNSSTQRFKLLKPLLTKFKRRWILTGSPAPNGLMDLFGQIYILDLGRSLGRFITHYRNNFFFPSGFGGYEWTPQPDAFQRIVEAIKPLILQMSAEDYLSMPELIFIKRNVSLDPKTLGIYKNLENEFITKIKDQAVVAGTQAVLGVKLRQIANGAVYDEYGIPHEVHSAKLDELESLLEELNGHPVLLLYEFDHDRSRIQARFGPDIPIIGGDSSTKRLATLIDRFNQGAIPVLMGNPASMGHGLNLQGACHHVILFAPTWNLEYHDQAIARVYRQGQASDRVFVYYICANDTKDEQVLKVLTIKDRTQTDLNTALTATHEQRML